MTREERHIAVLNRMLESMDVYDSIQPTEERKKAIKAAIQALSQEPCDDAISREAVNTLVDELARAISDERCHIPQRGRDTGHIMHDILELPSVTQKSGKWIKSLIYENIYNCSECGSAGYSTFKYCPKCGAKMVEPQESEESDGK